MEQFGLRVSVFCSAGDGVLLTTHYPWIWDAEERATHLVKMLQDERINELLPLAREEIIDRLAFDIQKFLDRLRMERILSRPAR